jgi:hypothetical protein
VYFFAISCLLHSKHCSKETGTKTGQDQRAIVANASSSTSPSRGRDCNHDRSTTLRGACFWGLTDVTCEDDDVLHGVVSALSQTFALPDRQLILQSLSRETSM